MLLTSDLDHRAVTTMRTLAMDAVQAANSGHPGTPMGMAPPAYWLWHRFLRFDPADPIWPNRDRFVLSIGHASMLLYSLLHLAEVEAVDAEYERVGHPSVALDDIRRFRQLDSRCPGHPEYALQQKFGFTPERLVEEARVQVARADGPPRRTTAREDLI